MRDYLSRLTGRVRHVTPALQPLLPSFFEAARVGISPGPRVEQSEIEQPSAAENAEPSVQTVRPRPKEERKSDFPATFSPGQEERVSAPPVPLTPRIQTTSQTASAAVPFSQSSTPLKQNDVSSEPIRPSVARERSGSRGERSGVPVNAPRPVEIRSVERVNVQPATAVKPIASALPTSIGRKPAEAQTKLVSPASTTPEIHVTIGRIEVRAISSPAPVQAPPRKPELSLDDYLRTRNQRAV